MSKYPDQRRNLNPHQAASAAMWLYSTEYAAGGGGSMDFWDSLPDYSKSSCRRLVKDILAARPEKDEEVPHDD